MDIEQDPELLAGFLDEAEDSLASVARLFVELEHDPTAKQTVEAIFRPVHSLKGNAAFFGLLTIKRVAHEMETVLDHVRKGRLTADRPVIDALLAGLDLLVALVDRVRGGGSDEDPAAVEPLSQRLSEQAGRATAQTASSDPEQDLRLIEAAIPAADAVARGALDRLRARLHLEAPKPPSPATERRVIAGRLAKLLEMARTTTLSDEDARQVMSELERLRDKAPDEAGKAVAQEAIDGMQVFVSAMGFEAAGAEYVGERLARMPWALTTEPIPPPVAALEPRRAEAPPAAHHETDTRRKDTETHRKDSEAHRKDGGGKSMRVAEGAIDTFLHYVGELVVVGDMFRHLQTRVVSTPGMQSLAREFRRANETFSGLSNQLQTSIMGIRRVAVKPLAQKVPRLVRDVAQAIGKEIDAVIEGESVQVDKSLLDLLDAPLTHMVRNAVDHGVEMPDRREAAGKPRRGTVTVSFAEAGNHVTLTVADDGAGLNLDAIRRKAESLGLISAGAPMGEQDIINMIFASGLSTAQQVTDISGRGVGMDVVKRALEDAGGSISVTTEAGKGSAFRIKLPRGVTTQIVGGYLVRAGGSDFVLPLDRVRETFRCRPEERQAMVGKGQCIMRRDQVLPLGELSALLADRPSVWPPRGLPVIIVESRRRRIALAVEAVLGVQKVVIRRLSGLPPGAPMLSGAALLGDGHLALVLDLDQLCIGDEP
ncbi:MAG: chemotaxis protein CheA [Planctomycetes bacterium]|nr:chemotaxis protein CheA [Planctomycetota bacterium]